MVRISRPGWICNNHGRILRLSSGRIVLPAHTPVKDGVRGAPYSNDCHLHSFVYYSDDGFQTWKESEDTMTAPGRGAHEPSVVELKDGRLVTGLMAESNPSAVTLLDRNNERHLLSRQQIEQLRESTVSLMPEGLLEGLQPGQIMDLFAYLQSDSPVGQAAQKPR